jgi:hypothetical protein
MKPIYSAKPIATEEALAAALGMDLSVLRRLADKADNSYTTFPIPKKNSHVTRDVVGPDHNLKQVQKRINRAIFSRINYPTFLYGGLPGRDYLGNARLHSGSGALIALDIKNFYPSIGDRCVKNIFKHFFRFSDSVAVILTKLTTLDGRLPQGACTSSYIANLVFWELEGRIVSEFARKGWKYSRLLDDICISTETEFSKKSIDLVIGKVSAMVGSQGLKLNAKKTRVSRRANPADPMTVTGLRVNSGAPKVSREDRAAIRSEIRRCELSSGVSRTDAAYHEQYNKVSGKVATLAYVGHSVHNARHRLQAILPYYDGPDIVKTKRLVRYVCSAPQEHRSKRAYVDRYFKVMYRLNIVARTHDSLARQLRSTLRSAVPLVTREKLNYG